MYLLLFFVVVEKILNSENCIDRDSMLRSKNFEKFMKKIMFLYLSVFISRTLYAYLDNNMNLFNRMANELSTQILINCVFMRKGQIH